MSSPAKRLVQVLLNRQPAPVQNAARTLIGEIRLARKVRHADKEFQRFKGATGLKLNLGCGGELKRGWINIDVGQVKMFSGNGISSTETVFIDYDLRRGTLPLENESCDIVYSSHFFEHLNYKQGVSLMRDCFRVLRPGGIFRVALPNLRQLFRAYLENDTKHLELIEIKDLLPEVEAGTETLVDYVNYGVYQYGEHKCIYDEEKVCLILQQIGFSSVGPTAFRGDIDPGTEVRRRYSFYVEAVK